VLGLLQKTFSNTSVQDSYYNQNEFKDKNLVRVNPVTQGEGFVVFGVQTKLEPLFLVHLTH
jgi:hypothetical protein